MPYLDPSASPKAPLVTPHSVPVITRTAPSSSTPTESKQNLSNKSTTPSGTPSASPSLRSHYFFSPSDDHSAVPLTSAMPGLPRRARSHGSASSSPVRVLSPPKPPGSILPRRAVTDKTVGTDEVESRDSGLGLSFDGSPNTPASESAPTTPTYLRPTSASPGPIQPRRKNSSPAGLPSTNILNRRTGSATSLLRVDIPSPPSGGSRGPSVQGVMSAPLPPPLIRKKSGELVKPSLKRRSTSTPGSAAVSDSGENDSNEHDAYWLCARSEPATPCEDGLPSVEKKTLRFAGGEDGEGGELEKVVLFKRDHKVTAVTRALEGEDVNGLGGTDTETEVEGFRISFHGAFNKWGSRPGVGSPGAGSSGSRRSSVIQDKIEFRREASSVIPRRQGLNLATGRGKIVLPAEGEDVMLEHVNLVDDGPENGKLSLKGTVVVRNITFGKWVNVRFTMDDWHTVSEVAASHSVHIPATSLGPVSSGSQGWDRFTFSIKLDDVRQKINEKTLLLAVKYSIDGGQEWWDSNAGANYRFQFNKQPSPLPSPSIGGPKSVSSKPRKTSMEGSAFLPLLESQGISVQPHYAPGTSPIKKPASTESHASPKAPTKSALVGGWPFPVSSYSSTATHKAKPSPGGGVQTTMSTSPSHITLKNYCPPTNALDHDRPSSSASAPSPNVLAVPFAQPKKVSPSPSGASTPTADRPGFPRKRTWDREVTPLTHPKSVESTYFLSPTKPRSGVSSPPSRPSVIASSPQVRKLALASSGLPSPPTSADQSPPSPGPSPLPETPNSARLELSPGVVPFDLPTQPTMPTTSPLLKDKAELDEKSRSAADGSKPDENAGSNYADFIDKYCFFRGEEASPPTSVPSSHNASPLSHPSYLPLLSRKGQTFFSPTSSAKGSGQSTPQLVMHSGQSSPLGYGPAPTAWDSAGLDVRLGSSPFVPSEFGKGSLWGQNGERPGTQDRSSEGNSNRMVFC
ncbi:Protein phosphatase, regulatory subunit PPP1R3C/D [Phaffia rhodozyma]|uniref:Protein phosphatase, regulatory subunit PPP1R3C/D n=1 Tax=Phaffia rhodozyma TaxID=264483 RepID=A0A0F7SU10_PHARH|nr:Protein phosphatase, regulatory subunit PPP1R3C/D [Phaffia rhodozyma]